MPEIINLVQELADLHGRTRECLLPILQDIVRKKKYLTDHAMLEVAKQLNLPAALIYGTATFYSYQFPKVRARFVIRVCHSIACYMKDRNQIIKILEEILKIKVGETTHDKKFTLLETNCLGLCHKGPSMQVNDKVYTELTPEKIINIISEYMKK